MALPNATLKKKPWRIRSQVFLKAPSVNQTGILDGQVVREISEPFSGCGILTPSMKDSFSDCTKYLNALEVLGHDWIFLEYHTWAGLEDGAGVIFAPFERGFWDGL